MQNLRENKRCATCASDEHDVLHYFPVEYYPHARFITHSWDGGMHVDLRLVRCKVCGLVYQNPCFTPTGLSFLYPETIIPETLDYRKLIANHKFGHLINQVILKFYPDSATHAYTVADIGSRFGVLPELLVKKGFQAFGIEFNQKAVEVARQNGFGFLFQGTIDDLDSICALQDIQSLNIVVLNDVIEHLLYPKDDFVKISKLQKRGDRIIVVTMNLDSWGYKLFGKYWYYIHAQHTYYFNEHTLRDFFNRVGYDVEYIQKIKGLKNLKIAPSQLLKLIKHLIDRRSKKELDRKKWFAENRPHLFDTFTIVLKKR